MFPFQDPVVSVLSPKKTGRRRMNTTPTNHSATPNPFIRFNLSLCSQRPPAIVKRGEKA